MIIELASHAGIRVFQDFGSNNSRDRDCIIVECPDEGGQKHRLCLTPEMVWKLFHFIIRNDASDAKPGLEEAKRFCRVNHGYRLQRKRLGIFFDTWEDV